MATTKSCAASSAGGAPSAVKECAQASENAPSTSGREKKSSARERRQRVGRQNQSKPASRNGGNKRSHQGAKERGKMAEVKPTGKPHRRELPSLSVDSGRGEELSSSCESSVFEIRLLRLPDCPTQPHCSSEAEEEDLLYQDCLSHISSEASSVYCTPLSTPHTHTPSPLPPSTLHPLNHEALCDSLGKVAQDRHLESCDSHVITTTNGTTSDSSCRPSPDHEHQSPPPEQCANDKDVSENMNCRQKSSFFIGDIELQLDSDHQDDEGVDFEVFSPTTKHSNREVTRKRASSRPGILSVPLPSHRGGSNGGHLTPNRHSFEFSSVSTASPQSSVCTSHPPSPLTLSPSPTTETAREPVFNMFDEANLSKYDIEFMHPEVESVAKRNMVYAHTLEKEQQEEALATMEAVREEDDPAGDCQQRLVSQLHQLGPTAEAKEQEDEWPDLSSPNDTTPVPDNSPILTEEPRPPPPVLPPQRPTAQVPWFHNMQQFQHCYHHPRHMLPNSFPPPPTPPFFPYPVSQAVQTGFYPPSQTGFWPPPPNSYPPRPMLPTEHFLPPPPRPSQAFRNPAMSNFVPAPNAMELPPLPPSPPTLRATPPTLKETDASSSSSMLAVSASDKGSPELIEPATRLDEKKEEEVEEIADSVFPEVQLSEALAAEPAEVEAVCDVMETHYPLHATWVMWYDRITSNNRSQLSDYKASLKTLSTVGYVEEFWRLYNNIVQPSELGKNATYHFFKKDIEPMWEHEANKNGGKWVLTVKDNVDLLDKTWMELLLSLIGEKMPRADLITGAVVSRRKKGDRIALWTNKKDKKHNLEICTKFIKVLALASDVPSECLPEFLHNLSQCSNGLKLEFMYHTDALKSHSSYKNDARLTVRDNADAILKCLTKTS